SQAGGGAGAEAEAGSEAEALIRSSTPSSMSVQIYAVLHERRQKGRNTPDASSNTLVASLKEQDVTPAVIDACRQGDRDAFRVLYEAYKDQVYSMALYFFHGDAAMAADVTQQVFLKLMGSIGQFRGDSGFATWLYRFVVNACIDTTRSGAARARTTDPAVLDMLPAAGSQEDTFAKAQIAGSVRAAVSSLAPKIRIAILLRYFEDLSYAEMAAVLRCSTGTVASRLSRGHETLARMLVQFRSSSGRER
ncbi:MAG: RNA polymerase sigma factor, partial [Vicinamibacterales bacterium]